MAQFDVYRNLSTASSKHYPYLVDVQSDLLDHLITRVVVPLALPEILGNKAVGYLNPIFEIKGEKLVLLTQEMAGITTRQVGPAVDSLKHKRDEIIRALDVVFSGV